jgi:flavin-dependent dehydrogenase
VLGQRRLHLDQVLLAAARETPGVRVFEEAPVEGAAIEAGRAVGLRVGGELRRAGLVVGADGIDSPVRRSLGLERRGPPHQDRRVGVRMHYRLAVGRTEPSRLEIFVGRGYELYVAPLPDGELLLAALGDRDALGGSARAALDRWIGEQPPLREWLDGATPLTKPAGRAPVTRRARAGFAPGAVLLGDAARASDPLTAGGIAHALVTAERLAAVVPGALAAGNPDAHIARFDRERRRVLRPHDWLTRALVALVDRPALARPTMIGMRAAPWLMRALLGVGGGVRLQPPASARVSAAPSAVAALPASSATDQNATLSQRAGSA